VNTYYILAIFSVFRFPNAAMEVQTEQALRVIRYVRRRSSPPIPENLRAMGDTIQSMTWRNQLLYCIDDEAPFFNGNLEYIENGEITFGGLLFVNLQFLQRFKPYIYGSRVLAVDGTFGVIPRTPGDVHQLVTIHVVLDNIVSDLLTVNITFVYNIFKYYCIFSQFLWYMLS